MERRSIEDEVCRVLGLDSYDPARYGRVFGGISDALARVVETRWRSRVDSDPLDHLVRAAPEAVVAWMKRKARLADGTRPGIAVLAPGSIDAALQALTREHPGWRIGRRDAWLVVRAGLIRELCGLGLEETGALVELSTSAVAQLARLHRRLLVEDDEYALRAGAVTRRALRACWQEESD
jgi:hypothetical protein